MKNYTVVISEQAQQGLRDLSYIIGVEYKSPKTANSYLRGIYNEMRKLSTTADSFSILKSSYFLQYGFNVRRLSYKGVTIIHTINDDAVYIQAVMLTSTIKGI